MLLIIHPMLQVVHMLVAHILPQVFLAGAMTVILSASSIMLSATTTEKSGQDLVRIVFHTHQQMYLKTVILTPYRVLVPLLGMARMKLHLILGLKSLSHYT